MDKNEVADFLREVSAAISLGHCGFRGREKNTQGLIDLGLTENQAWEIIKKLKPENYSRGPVQDDQDNSKEIWIFGYDHDGTEVYIKLRLAQMPGKKTIQHLLVWSFHAAEHTLKYPFRATK